VPWLSATSPSSPAAAPSSTTAPTPNTLNSDSLLMSLWVCEGGGCMGAAAGHTDTACWGNWLYAASNTAQMQLMFHRAHGCRELTAEVKAAAEAHQRTGMSCVLQILAT
jgi:hypothetical protein